MGNEKLWFHWYFNSPSHFRDMYHPREHDLVRTSTHSIKRRSHRQCTMESQNHSNRQPIKSISSKEHPSTIYFSQGVSTYHFFHFYHEWHYKFPKNLVLKSSFTQAHTHNNFLLQQFFVELLFLIYFVTINGSVFSMQQRISVQMDASKTSG